MLEKKHLVGRIYDRKNTRFVISQCGFYRENYDPDQELCELCCAIDENIKNREKYSDNEVVHLLKANFSDVEDTNENLVSTVINALAILKGEKSMLKKQINSIENDKKSLEEKISFFNKMSLFKKVFFILFKKKV